MIQTLARYSTIAEARAAKRAIAKYIQYPVLCRAVGPWSAEDGSPVFPGWRGVEVLILFRKTIAAIVDGQTIILHPEEGATVQFMIEVGG